jgi:hypothetical protein
LTPARQAAAAKRFRAKKTRQNDKTELYRNAMQLDGFLHSSFYGDKKNQLVERI